jgi:hypothetical protein
MERSEAPDARYAAPRTVSLLLDFRQAVHASGPFPAPLSKLSTFEQQIAGVLPVRTCHKIHIRTSIKVALLLRSCATRLTNSLYTHLRHTQQCVLPGDTDLRICISSRTMPSSQ